jgi:hypothetical protein
VNPRGVVRCSFGFGFDPFLVKFFSGVLGEPLPDFRSDFSDFSEEVFNF